MSTCFPFVPRVRSRIDLPKERRRIDMPGLMFLAWVSLAQLGHAQNAVVNGSFEDPALTGINSDYMHTPQGNTTEGTWWNAPHDPGNAWGPPRGANNDGRMSVNGDDSANYLSNRVWYQSVSVIPGQLYEFSAWAWATVVGNDGYQLRFAFDGAQVGDIMIASAEQTWESFNATYTPNATPLELSIVNVSNLTFPNDFMLDDIALVPVPEPSSMLCLGIGIVMLSFCHRKKNRQVRDHGGTR